MASVTDLNAFLNALSQLVAQQTPTNAAQAQGSSQQGQFGTTGNTATTGTQQQQGTNQTQQQQSQQQAGTTIGSTTGTTQQQQTGLTQPIDTLGLGAMLSGAVPQATSTAGTTNDFLSGLVKNGPAQQQALTSQAVSQALSGPGMVGAGQGAQARAAGNAGAQVGLNSLNQQLQAASQLSGPNALTTLAGAGNPFIGQQTSGNVAGSQQQSTNNQTNQNTTGTSNTLNLSDLISKSNTNTNESQSGTSSAQGGQVGVGQQPIQQTSTAGGCYVCTAYVERGWMDRKDVVEAATWKLARKKYQRSLAGYSIYGPLLAKLIRSSTTFARLFYPVARAVLTAELCLANGTKATKFEQLCHAGFHYGSLFMAIMCGRRFVKPCDYATRQMLETFNLSFQCPRG